MIDGHALLELAADHAHNGQAVAVGGVHVGLNLEDEAGEVRLGGRNLADVGGAGQRRRRDGQKRLQERLHAEVGDRRAEEQRREAAFQHGLLVKGVARHVQKLDLFAQAAEVMRLQRGGSLGAVQLHRPLVGHAHAVVAAGIEQNVPALALIDALKVAVHADGPVHGAGADAQHLLQLLHQRKGVLAGAVHLVDEGEDGDVAQAADLEELDGLFLYALGRVDEHDRRVRRHQHAVGILAEILVAGGVQNVDAVAVVFKLHGAGGYADAALLFDLHPVAGGVALGLAGLDAAGLADGAAIEQQLFGQRGLAGVRVADDGERAPFVNLFQRLRAQGGFAHAGQNPLFPAIIHSTTSYCTMDGKALSRGDENGLWLSE